MHLTNWSYNRFKKLIKKYFTEALFFQQRLSLLGPDIFSASDIYPDGRISIPETEIFLAILEKTKLKGKISHGQIEKKPRIIIKRTEAIGDVVWTTPVVREIALTHPDNDVIVITKYTEIFAGNPYVSYVAQPSFNPSRRDVFIDLDYQYEMRPDLHILDAYAKAANILITNPNPEIFLEENNFRQIESVLKHKAPMPYDFIIGIHMASKSPDRVWPINYWKELFKLISKNRKILFILLGGEGDYQLITSINFINLVGKCTIRETAAALYICDLLIAPDSGLTHLSAAVNTPFIGLYGMAESSKRLPKKGLNIGIQTKLECSGCLHRESPPVTRPKCPLKKSSCMESICPEQVSIEADKMLITMKKGQWRDRILHKNLSLLPPDPDRNKNNFLSQKNSLKVSIIIPLFNKLDFTRQCLNSIFKNTDFRAFEIILIDNASTDDTIDFLKKFVGKHPNIKVVYNSENFGFAKACNQGARVASGKYLVFLNNDTIPKAQWLDEMVKLAERDASIGIVGSKLLYPDGRIQHAGVVVSASKLPYHLYRGCPGNIEGADKQRDFQIVTAACMLISRELFFEVGGFDERYINGCEDIDLCLKVRQKNKRVVYNPKSILIHFEGQTQGRQDKMDHNRHILLNTWQDKLKQDDKHYLKQDGMELLVNRDGSLNFVPSSSNTSKIKTSIIIVTYNSASDIAKCIESVVNSTSFPYEIIIIDNASSDGTQEYLSSLKNAKITLNSTNQGFAKGCNQGIQIARGEYVVLLNPDTIVTQDWDVHMIDHFEKNVGAVGPVSNYVAAKQKIGLYFNEGLSGKIDINALGNRLYQLNRGKSIETKLLIGFCMMIKRKVLDKVGMLDEDLFLGNDDLDYSLRLRNKGYGLLVATDTFIYHKGQASFKSKPSETTTELVQKSTDVLYKKLQKHYGRDKVPSSQELWGIDWFKPSKGIGKEKGLTSVIILAYNQLEYTKKCLQSIYENTRNSIELIIVDNGSTDGTLEFLESQFSINHPSINRKVIKNPQNLGFAAGNNQGIAAAKGSHILLMNNDIVVTPGWLDRMLECMRQHPQTGIVGPKSNYVSGPQQINNVPYDTQSLSGLNQYALRISKENRGSAKRLIRVVGFCMLIKREVIDKIGGFDGRYGLGNFEDDDFSLRAAIAGFESWMAEDCFVHHFGNRTFIGENIDYRQSLEQNWEIFKQKWGLPQNLEYGSGYHIKNMKFDSRLHFVPFKPDQTSKPPADEAGNQKEGHMEVLYAEAQSLLEKNQTENAALKLEELLATYPDFAPAHNDLGICCHNRGELEKALASYQKAVELEPQNITFQKNLADFYCVALGKIKGALEIYVRVLRQDPFDVECLLAMGYICRRLERFEDAESFYARVLAVDAGNEAALEFMGLEKTHGTKAEAPLSAEAAYEQLLEDMRHDSVDTGISKICAFLAAFPDMARAHSDLGALHQRAGDSEKAGKHFKKAAALEKGNPQFQKNLADFYLVTGGQKAQALGIYTKLLEKDPCDEQLLLLSGHLCVALKRMQDAARFYRRLLAIAPGNTDARTNLEAIERIEETRGEKSRPPAETPQSGRLQEACAGSIAQSDPTPAETPGGPQVSILIPASGPAKQLRRCVQAIQQHTDTPHEILFIDSGTTRGTAKWLREFLSGNPHCRCIRCRPDAGPAAAVNAAIAASTGRFIVRLAFDVLVSPQWLPTMLAHLEHNTDAGIIGAMSNFATARQKVISPWSEAESTLEAFALAYRQRNRHRRIPAESIDGFCMVFTRQLYESIGPFDEELGKGGYDGEDFCLRAALAGYQNLIAGDVYLHRRPQKTSARDKRAFNLKWGGPDIQNLEGKRYFALQILQKARRAWLAEDFKSAGDLYLQAIGLVPENKAPYLRLAEMLIETRQYENALEVLDELPQGDPGVREVVLKASCREGLEQLEGAQQLADQVLETHPSFAPALNLKGILAFRHSDHHNALRWFTRATAADPGFGEAHTNLGALQWEAGEKDAALDLYERAFILEPAVADIAANYHTAIAELEQYERAVPILREATAIYPSSKKIRYMLIDCLIHLQEYEAAMEIIEGAIADFGVEDGILASALKIREMLGPLKIENHDSDHATVSLCMIVKDEEAHLAKCLRSVKPVVDEIVVVDTGSTDVTKDIATIFGARVFGHDWQQDFSAARNLSLVKAKGNVIFILDADEVLSPKDYVNFRQFANRATKEPAAFLFTTRNYVLDTNLFGWVENDGSYAKEEHGTGWMGSDKTRLFPNRPGIEFCYQVHELIEPSLDAAGIPKYSCPVPIHHYGKLDLAKAQAKKTLYYQIGRQKLDQLGDNPAALRELAIQAETLGKHDEAISLWEKLIAIDPKCAGAYVGIGISYCKLNQYDRVIETARKALEIAPQMKEARYNYALGQLHMGNVDETKNVLEELAKEVPGYLPALFILAAAYCCNGAWQEGCRLFKKLFKTAIGPGLPQRARDLAKRLMSSNRPEYASAILQAIIDTQKTNEDVLDSHRQCIEMANTIQRTGA